MFIASSAFLNRRVHPLRKSLAYVADLFKTSPAPWAATFCLRGFKLVQAVFLCNQINGYAAYFFTTDGYGIFNLRATLGGVRLKQVSLHKS